MRAFSWIMPRFLSNAGRGSNTATKRFVHVEKQLETLGVTLPPLGVPRASYKMTCWHGDLL